mmetsp:Transcript_30061/g.55210  ORF Transcript_30061/g.55210 Transcript_30061/m.55210 type:complete len:677 (-) Transcript_30061:45-2075(-)
MAPSAAPSSCFGQLRLCLACCLACCSFVRVHAVNLRLFEVNTTIQARFATTRIKVLLNNTRNCAEPTSFTFRLPKNARVTSLVMSMSDGCDMSSTVRSEADAKQMFEDALKKGQAAAMLRAYNSSNYAVKAVLPPLGEATINIEYGELLQRRKGQVDFMLPLAPSIPAESINAYVAIKDVETGVRALRLDDAQGVSRTVTQHGDGSADANIGVDSAQTVPTLGGSFDVGPLPEDGLLMSDDDGCVVHLFNPPSLQQSGPLRKNIVFVIDVSGSMSGQKLEDTKVAFGALLDMMTVEDAVTIQTFSNKGVEAAFGPKLATASNLLDAAAWVQALVTIGGTNLNDAYLDGLTRVQEMQELRGPGYVPIIVVMSDGQASSGVTNREEIAGNVAAKNRNIRAKIYSLAFGAGADFQLLMGIALQNGGVAKMIYEGYGDSAKQMQDFIEGELGSVLLSDISVLFQGRQVQQQTKTKFPILAGGSEVAVRARIPLADRRLRSLSASTLRAVTSASAYSDGATAQKSWTALLDLSATNVPWLPRGDCTKAFAHGKISELLNLRSAASALGNALWAEAETMLAGATNASRRLSGKSIEDQAKDEALRLAIEAQLVWPGLTAMIAVQGSGCSNATAETCAAENSSGRGGAEEAMDSTGAQVSSTSNVRPMLFTLAVWLACLLSCK